MASQHLLCTYIAMTVVFEVQIHGSHLNTFVILGVHAPVISMMGSHCNLLSVSSGTRTYVQLGASVALPTGGRCGAGGGGSESGPSKSTN